MMIISMKMEKVTHVMNVTPLVKNATVNLKPVVKNVMIPSSYKTEYV